MRPVVEIAASDARTVESFDYHVNVGGHYYSVPHALVGHAVWARFTASAGDALAPLMACLPLTPRRISELLTGLRLSRCRF